ncbi:hypothetical protein [Simkania sp.]|uniref:hypothetical protein n=1 Tax=Simkania sp. TaxID=34094 RepID=UPI003B519500
MGQTAVTVSESAPRDITYFESFMTRFTRINFTTALVGTVAGAGIYFALKYFEKTIDNYDNRPDSLTQKTYTHIETLSEMMLKAGIYIGIQGFILSQILNVGYYIVNGHSAINYSQALVLSFT